jgi:hypothetical protein
MHVPEPAGSSLRKVFHGALLVLILFAAWDVRAQSKTTDRLEDQFPRSRSFFFYHNTLRMINQAEDPNFDAAIKDIEKMKLLMVDTREGKFDFKKIVSDYQAEAFEPIMTSRHEGRNFDVFIKEKNGNTTAMLALVNDKETLFVLDILGRIDPGQLMRLFTILDEKSDISKNIRAFGNRDDDNEDGDDNDEK